MNYVPYEQWKQNIINSMDEDDIACECDYGNVDCEQCDGLGEIECECCEVVSDCKECNGDGYVECTECGGDATHCLSEKVYKNQCELETKKYNEAIALMKKRPQ